MVYTRVSARHRRQSVEAVASTRFSRARGGSRAAPRAFCAPATKSLKRAERDSLASILSDPARVTACISTKWNSVREVLKGSQVEVGGFVNTKRMVKKNFSTSGIGRWAGRYRVEKAGHHHATVLDPRGNAVWGD